MPPSQHTTTTTATRSKATWRQLREDRQAALKALTKGIQAPGAPCGLHYTRARVLSYLKKFEMAAADYKRYLELAPPDHRSIPDAHYALALDLFTKGGPVSASQLARPGPTAGPAGCCPPPPATCPDLPSAEHRPGGGAAAVRAGAGRRGVGGALGERSLRPPARRWRLPPSGCPGRLHQHLPPHAALSQVGYQPSEAKMFAGMMLQAPAFRGR